MDNRWEKILGENAKRNQEQQAQRIIDMQVELQSKIFDKAATYNNIIVSLGYAGFL